MTELKNRLKGYAKNKNIQAAVSFEILIIVNNLARTPRFWDLLYDYIIGGYTLFRWIISQLEYI